MSLFINKLLSSAVQIVLFTLVPFVWWLVTARKKQNFFDWIGLKKPQGGKKTFFGTLIVALIFLVFGAFTIYTLGNTETATSDFAGLGIKAIPVVLVYAILNTSLPEEILFRGFLLKRISNKFGFGVANVIQSLVFGIMHGVMFFSLVGISKAILIIAFTSSIAWFMGYINEKKANGSIIPSWTIHALSNIFSGLCAAFMIF